MKNTVSWQRGHKRVSEKILPWRTTPRTNSLTALAKALHVACVLCGLLWRIAGKRKKKKKEALINWIDQKTLCEQEWHGNRHLINECKRNSSNEEKKWHDEISQVNPIPGGMSYDGKEGTPVIHQYHKLKFNKGKAFFQFTEKKKKKNKTFFLLICLKSKRKKEWRNRIQKQRGRGRRQGRRFGWVWCSGIELAPNRWAATVADQPFDFRCSDSILRQTTTECLKKTKGCHSKTRWLSLVCGGESFDFVSP